MVVSFVLWSEMAEPADAAVQADLQSALQSASEGLLADMSHPESESGAPASPVEATPSVPVPPVATAAPTTIDTQALSPEARRFLDMHGGDPNKALAKALADNNRLAELHRSGQPTVPAQAPIATAPPAAIPQALLPMVAAPAPPPVDLPPVVVELQEIQPHVKKFVASDPVCLQLDQTFTNNLGRLQSLQSEAQTHNVEIQKAQWELTLPHVVGDPMAQADIQVRIREARSNLLLLQQEKFVLETENSRTGQQWQQRKDQYERQVYAYLSEQKDNARQTEYHAAQQAHAEQALTEAWPREIHAAMSTFGIPAEEQQAFNTFCKNAAIAGLDFGLLDQVEAHNFVSEKAVEYAAMIDRGHRYRSATYGQLATQRAAINSTPGPAAIATTAPQATNMSLEQMLEAAAAGFRADVTA